MKLSRPTSLESLQFIYDMATLRQDFSVPPPMFTHGLPPMAPMAIWELHFEKRISQMLSSVTDNLMKNINILSDKLNNIEKTNQEITKNQNQVTTRSTIIPPLMRIPTKPLLPTPTNGAGNNRWTHEEPREGRGPRDGRGPMERRGPMIWGATRARAYQPSTNKNQGVGHGEGGERAGKVATKEPNHNTKTHSENPDFPAILKGVHKLASISHHKGNWIKTPPSITKNITRITENIKPPMVDEDFSSRVRLLGEQFAEGLSSLVQEHLNNKEQEVEQELMRLNPADKKLVIDIVKQQFIRKQGRKFDNNKMRNLINTAVDVVGFNFTRPCTTQNVPSVATFNKFQCLELEDEPATEDEVEDIEDFHEAQNQGAGSENNLSQPTVPHKRTTTTDEGTRAESVPISHPTAQPENHIQPTSTTTTRTLRPRQTTSSTKPTSHEYAELRKKKIHIYPNKSRPSTTDLSEMPHPETQVLILADSNLQFTREIPHNWEVLSVSGLKIEAATSILQDLPEAQTADTLKHVVIAVGINDRRDSKPPLADCIRSAAGLKFGLRKVSFLEVVDPGSARTKDLNASANIQRLNQAARSATDVHFVPAPSDPTYHGAGFHFDAAYTDKIIKVLNMHVTSLN